MACRRTSRITGHPKLRESAVFGGTADPALAAEICADPGVRCAASQASSAAAWPGCPVAAPDSAHPSTMSPDELGQRREDAEGQPAARGGGVQRLVPGPEPGAAAAQPGHDGDQVLPGPGQPVPARDDEGVAGAEVVRARGEPGTAGGLARLLAGEDPDAAGLDQGAGRRSKLAGSGASGSSSPATARPAGQHHPATGRKTAVPQLSDTPASQHLFQALATS